MNAFKNQFLFSIIVVALVVIGLSHDSMAGGGQHYPLGSESLLCGLIPRPGLYSKTYFYQYSASNLKDNSGHTLKKNKDGAELDHLNSYSIAPRVLYISEKKILGWYWGQQLLVPFVKVDMKLNTMAGSMHEDRFSIGDIRYSPAFMSYHSADQLFHAALALPNFDLPTGSYNATNLVNIGKNHWSISPGFAFTWFLPFNPKFSVSSFIQYAFNMPNNDYIIGASQAAKIGDMSLIGRQTHLTPGQEFMADYGIDYAVSDKLRLGIAGYYYQQTTDDHTGVGTIKNDKGMVFAIGPAVAYCSKQWFFDFHVDFETTAKNRPQGVTSLFSVVYSFGAPLGK